MNTAAADDSTARRLPPRFPRRLRHAATRAGAADGFGLIELLIALTLLSVSVLALFAAYSSGYLALDRAARIDNAAMLADQQMERYRAETWNEIAGSSNATVVGADGRTYALQATVAMEAAPGTARLVKHVTITVQDAHGRTWARVESVFDQLGGG